MNTSLYKLTALVRPPGKPVENTGDWEAAERQIGCALPNEFKDFVELYGTGKFHDRQGPLIFPLNPFASRSYENILHANSEKEANDLANMIQDELDRGYLGDVVPQWFELFLKNGALLCWATTDVAVNCYWRTEGHPDQWWVAVVNLRSNKYQTFEGETMLSFLEGLFSGRLSCSLFPDEFAKG